MQVSIADRPKRDFSNRWYVSNRPPLLTSPFVKLPLGSVRARGWIQHQLELMAQNWAPRMLTMATHLTDDSGWLGGDKYDWERPAYWLRGVHDLAVLLDDKKLYAEAERWISGIVQTQDADGYFGERDSKCRVDSQTGQRSADLWPHMVVIDALVSRFEHCADERIIPLLLQFFRWCDSVPVEELIPWPEPGSGFGPDDWKPFISWVRAGDMLPHLYWIFNHTEQAWLLDLAHRIHQRIRPPEGEWLANHTVDFVQRFREPGTYFALSGDPAHLIETEYWYDKHKKTWGQRPDGLFAADEFIRPGKTDPKQATETCTMIEMNKSSFILGKITGQVLYADRCEQIQFNSYPAAHMPDMKGLHYLTAPNQPTLDDSGRHDHYNEHYQSTGFLAYDPSPQRYRCCQYNSAMGWPYYVEHLWMATADNGLVAWLYGPSEVRAKVGDGGDVHVSEETDYPFDEKIKLKLAMERPVGFPLYLRVPSWCHELTVAVNGQAIGIEAIPGKYVVIERSWSDGDTVDLVMPMEISLSVWEQSGHSVTVDRGPLSYSLRIEEQWRKCGGTDEWPRWEVLPATPWNYGLIVDEQHPKSSFEVVKKNGMADQPWKLGNAPIELRAKGKRIPNWQLLDGCVTDLQPSPVRSAEPVEDITLVPMGCARLRMSCLPTISDGPNSLEWKQRITHELFPLAAPHSMVQHGLGPMDSDRSRGEGSSK